MAATLASGFLDRTSEREVLDRVLANAREGQSAVLVMRGEAGIGKTALLPYAARQASGFRVAQVAGVEAEMELPLAGIHLLCAPVLEQLDALPQPQQNALNVALGLAPGDVPDRFLVGLAVLGLISAAAEERPLLCRVEDARRARHFGRADDLGIPLHEIDKLPAKGVDACPPSPNIVLVHGAWADGSCWSNVIERLQADGYKVTAPQLPESSLADDVARVRHVLTRQSGPTVLAAHSYGGQVITSLGTDAPNVVGLVYIAGFGLDEGESIGALLQQGPPTPAVANVDIDSEGFGWIPEDDFLGHFAPDIDPVKAKVMYAVQQPLHLSTFDDVMGTPAWKSLPSWYLVAENDEVIPPDAERQFAQRMGADTIEVVSGHCAMISHPEETHERIVTAANAVAVPG